MRTRRRIVRAGAVVAFMAGLAVAGVTAFACTGTSTLTLSRGGVATVGQTVTGTGANFSYAAGNSPVSIYFNGFSGTLLASAAVAPNGTISYNFVVPNVAPGYYFVGAVETNSSGSLVTMNHPKAALTVNAAPPVAQQPPANPPAQPPAANPVQAQPPAAQPPAAGHPAAAPARPVSSATKPVTATGTQPQAPAAQAPAAQAPAVAQQAPAAQAPVVQQPAAANIAPVDGPAQPALAPVQQVQPVSGSTDAAHSSSHPTAVLAFALVLGVLVLSVAVAAFVVSGRQRESAEARTRH